MKRIISSVLIALFPFMLFAEFNNGPKLDYCGKPSASGQALSSWVSLYNENWQKSCFVEINEELIAWETEKMFKEKIFKMDFFPQAYVNADYAANYLFLHPAAAKKMLPLVVSFYRAGNRSYNLSDEKFLYILLNSGDDDLKQELLRQGDEGQAKSLIKKYDEIYSRQKPVPAEELKKKTYDKYLRSFEQSNSSTSMNPPEIKDWLENWDFESTIRDILKQKAVGDKNFFAFVRLLDYADTISDGLAGDIIRYFKLDTPSPQINQVFLEALGKNPVLDKLLLKDFKNFKPPRYPNAYYSAATLALNMRISPETDTKTLLRNLSGMSLDFMRTYARLTSYDKAFKWFLEAEKKYAEGPGDINFWEGTLGLLEKGSDLNMQSASIILAKNMVLPLRYKLDFSPKFAKLLQKKNFRGIAALFPFESLTPEGQKALFAVYAEVMKKNDALLHKTVIVEKLSKLKSPVYRSETIKLLMGNESQPGDDALQALSLEWLPELLTVAAGKDLTLAVKACELIGKTSLLGKAAAPKLRELLDAKNNFTVKIAAICALAEIGDKDSIPRIKKFFDDKNRLLARAAKQAVYLLQPLDEKDKFFEEMLKNKPRQRR